jgi:hypothetical protein
MRSLSFIFNAGAVFSLLASGCTTTRDVSSAPEYKQWIGRPVELSSPGEYAILAPKWSRYYLGLADSNVDNDPILGRVAEGQKVIIQSVKETKGNMLIGGPYTHVHLILTMEHPVEKNKRITVESQLNYVAPFKDRDGFRMDYWRNEKNPIAVEEKTPN